MLELVKKFIPFSPPLYHYASRIHSRCAFCIPKSVFEKIVSRMYAIYIPHILRILGALDRLISTRPSPDVPYYCLSSDVVWMCRSLLFRRLAFLSISNFHSEIVIIGTSFMFHFDTLNVFEWSSSWKTFVVFLPTSYHPPLCPLSFSICDNGYPRKIFLQIIPALSSLDWYTLTVYSYPSSLCLAFFITGTGQRANSVGF